MKRFPKSVRDSMEASGASVTCIPVSLDGGSFETAVFFQLGGPQSKTDRKLLRAAKGPIPFEIEADLIEHPNANVVMLRFEVYTLPDNPLAGEVLLTPGSIAQHFEVLKKLGSQPRLCWFFADRGFWVLHSQQHPLAPPHHATFNELANEAARKDAVIRMTGHYDAGKALSDIVANYQLRSDTTPPAPGGQRH